MKKLSLSVLAGLMTLCTTSSFATMHQTQCTTNSWALHYNVHTVTCYKCQNNKWTRVNTWQAHYNNAGLSVLSKGRQASAYCDRLNTTGNKMSQLVGTWDARKNKFVSYHIQ